MQNEREQSKRSHDREDESLSSDCSLIYIQETQQAFSVLSSLWGTAVCPDEKSAH